MDKLLILSTVPALLFGAIYFSRDKNPRRGLKRGLYFVVGFNALYVLGLIFILPRIV